MYSKKFLWFSLFFTSSLWACTLIFPMDDGGKGKGGGGGGSTEEQEVEIPPGWNLDEEGKPTEEGITANGVGQDEEGNLVLDQGVGAEYAYMWLADSGNGMVSKFDMRTGQELARYRSAIPVSCNEGEIPERNNCTGRPDVDSRINYSPSRTAIDVYGNAWVANRGFGLLSSVTKIAMDERLCVDRNGNGQIDTSRSSTEVLNDDECVLFTTPVCSGYNGARALAISKGQGGAGDVWVGCFDDQYAYQLNSTNGRIERGPIQLAISPYGAIVDSEQNLWMSYYPYATVQGVNTRTGAVIGPAESYPTSGCSSYGLAVDGDNRIWLAGVSQGGAVACAYDHYAPGGPRWRRCAITTNIGDFGAGRGIAVDKNGNIYMSSNNGVGRLIRFRWNDADGPNGSCRVEPIAGQNTVNLGLNRSLLGVGFDREENPWVVALGNQAARVNLSDGTILRTTPAAGHNPNYYTYSDFTGYQLRNFTAPQGTYTWVYKGCPSYSSWKSISLETRVPANTQIEVYVRVANTLEGLFSAHRHGPFGISPSDAFVTSTIDLSEIPQSTFMQLELVLRSDDRESSPAIRGKPTMKWACSPPIG